MSEKTSQLNERVAKLEQLVINIGEWVKETKDTLKNIEQHIRQSIEFQQEQKHMITQQANMNIEMNRINSDILATKKEHELFHDEVKLFMVDFQGKMDRWNKKNSRVWNFITPIVASLLTATLIKLFL